MQTIDRSRFFTGVQNDIPGNFVIATQSRVPGRKNSFL
jgi:hypothetical protein